MPPTHLARRGKDSPYGSSIICGFIAVFILFFSLTSWSQKADLEDKIAARTEAQDAQWVPVKARLQRDKTSPSYAQPEERVSLLYDCQERENYSISTIPIPMHQVASHLDIKQETITEETLVPIFYLKSQPSKWDMNYQTKPMLQERLARLTKLAQVTLTLGLLLMALTVQLVLRTRKKLKTAQDKPEVEDEDGDEDEEDASTKPSPKKNGGSIIVLPLVLFAFSGIWLGTLSCSFWPRVIETLPASNYPTVTGTVLDMRGHTSRKSRFTVDHSAVQFEWKGKSYITREQGLGFGKEEFNQALKARQCTVYVNEAQPERSLLIGGVPIWHLSLVTIFTLVGCLPAVLAIGMIASIIRVKSPRRKTQAKSIS